MSLRDYLFHEEPGITLYCGDAREITLNMHGIDRMITDPPYGADSYATDDSRSVVPLMQRCQPRASTLAVFGFPELLISWLIACEYQPSEWITWWPTNKVIRAGRDRLPRESEAIAIMGDIPGADRIVRPRSRNPLGRAVAQKRGHNPDVCRDGDVWRDPSPKVGMAAYTSQRFHPNEKPLGLMERLTLLCSNKGDLILDPFVGSGTTLLAAKKLNRRAIGIEIEPKYCEIAVKRLRQEVLPL